MLTVDPLKMLLVLVVALVVLGPDRLPSAVRRFSAFVADLRRWRAAAESEMQRAVGALPFADELRNVGQTLGSARSSVDPRHALYRAAGLVDGAERVEDGGVGIANPDPELN